VTLPIIYLYTDLEYQATDQFDDLMPIVRAQLDPEPESVRVEKHSARSTSDEEFVLRQKRLVSTAYAYRLLWKLSSVSFNHRL
jgi:hypothetical protein